MDNFFKNIKVNLENRPEPSFNPGAWDLMKDKLAVQPTPVVKSNPLNKWIPLLALLLTCSTALNYWLFFNVKNTASKGTSLIHQVDTIFQTNVIYQTDTIYQTKYLQNKNKPISDTHSSQNDNSVSNVDNFIAALKYHTLNGFYENIENLFSSKQYINKTSTSMTKLPSYSLLKEWKEDLAQEKTSIPNTYVSVALNPILSQKFSEIKSPVPFHGLNYNNVQSTIYKKSFNEMIYPMRPKSFKVGLTTGIVLLNNQYLESSSNFAIGLEPSILFSDQLELFGDISYYHREIETEEMNNDYGVPVIDSGNDEATFNDAEINQDILQYGVGLKYFFLNKKKFRPYIGAGFYNTFVSNYVVKYQFEVEDNSGGGGNNEDEDDIEILQPYADFKINNQLLLRGGIEYQFLNKWYLQVDASYNFNLNSNTVTTPENMGIKTGIYRKF